MQNRALAAALVGLLAPIFSATPAGAAATALTDYAKHEAQGRGWLVTTDSGQALKITPYGDGMLRVQAAPAGQSFVADDRYLMVQSHAFAGALAASEEATALTLSSPGGVAVRITKRPVRMQFLVNGVPMASEPLTGGLVTGDRPLDIKVNGQSLAAALSFPTTGAWTRWAGTSVSAQLNAGSNTVRATAAGANGGNIDSLTVNQTVYEAETAARSGAAYGNQNGGFTGTGYVDFQNTVGDYVEWTVTVPSAGSYSLGVRYANGTPASEVFAPTPDEHFFGLGYGGFGRVTKLDLRGSVVSRNRTYQAPILTPFYLSSRGYGVFVNSTYPNTFSFLDTDYHLELTAGQLDYFFIAGPGLPEVLDRYTQLTGRPRLPPLAAFGLALSDQQGAGLLPSSEAWWKEKVGQMRSGNYPFDLIVHDNSWRNGKTAAWEWNTTRYPDPAEFESWCQQNGITNQLDFNRADDTLSAGWQASYLMPGTGDFPDFSSPAVRTWFWNLLKSKSFDPALKYPGDFLWLDEPDDDVTPSGPLADGRLWDEDANYYFFLEAQAVGEGWEATFKGSKRPYLMSRGMTAGAQRWATTWSGDIESTYAEEQLQIRGMLAAGLSGFPFWAHDAGGFKAIPSDPMYRQWSVAMGSFSPLWKPHGPGFRFPWLFSANAQDDMRAFGALRMRLIPYLYTTAYVAATTGLPIARAMILEHPTAPEAWAADQQYMWGDALLVAPNTTDGGAVSVWMPPLSKGYWYDFWDESAAISGGTAISYPAPTGKLPLFVRAGAIIPGALPMQGTKYWDRTTRLVDVYTGANGVFTQFEDDGLSDHFNSGQRALTAMSYDDEAFRLTLVADDGTYPGAPNARRYRARFHGVAVQRAMEVNGQPLPTVATEAEALIAGGVVWDAAKHVLLAITPPLPVSANVAIGPAGSTVIPAGAKDGGAPPGVDAGRGSSESVSSDTPGSGNAGGCGCRAATVRPEGSFGLFLASAAAVLGATRRRRRTDQASATARRRSCQCSDIHWRRDSQSRSKIHW